FQFRGGRLDAKLRPETVHQSQHEGVPTDERVAGEPLAVVAEYRGDAHGPLGGGHVARLATATLSEEGAMAPFLIVHLLGQRADDAAVLADGFSDEGVAGCAELGVADMDRLLLFEPCYRVHDAPSAGVDGLRAEGAPLAVRERSGDDEVPVEAFARAEAFGGELVADRARDAVEREIVERRLRITCRVRDMREDLSFPAGGMRDLL